jgi:hypothetical protein
MKKLVFCIGAMLIAATGFSQNVNDIEQHGINNVNVNQLSTLVDYYNDSYVWQHGLNNDADIDQIGENRSYVHQRWLQNEVVVFQDGGDGASGYGPASMQESEIVQAGEMNKAFVTQVGEGNQSFIDQFNYPPQGDPNMELGNLAAVDQEGRNNFSDIDQDHHSNWAQTNQFGNGNVSLTTQESYALAAPLHSSGYLQGSYVDQIGEFNFANVYQNGDNQLSIVTQSADNPFPGEEFTNEAWVNQYGELNFSNIDQSDCTVTIPPWQAANNFAEVNQTNTIGSLGGNISNVVQTGGNTAFVNQVNGN